MKIYEFRGVRNLVAAEVIEDSDSAYVTGTPFAVAGVSSIARSTDSSNEAHYYDNMAAVVVSSTSADSVEINTSAIELDVLAKLTGQRYDADKGLYIEQERDVKNYAIGYITKDTNGNERFVWRLKGSFSIPGETNNTEDSGTEAQGQTVTFTGINTTYRFELNGKGTKSVVVDTSVNPVDETAFFATVQTPDTIEAPVVHELTNLVIASTTLSPSFDTAVTSYTASTSSASNKVTATVSNSGTAEIKVNGTEIENGSTATWQVGTNTLTVKVDNKTYTVTVTKSE